MKFTIVFFSFLSFSICADNKLSSAQAAFTGQVISIVLTASPGIFDALTSKSEPEATPSPLEVSRRIRSLENQRDGLQLAGKDQERAGVEAELDRLCGLRETLVRWALRKTASFLPALRRAIRWGEDNGRRSPVSSNGGSSTPTTTAVGLEQAESDDSWETQSLPSAIANADADEDDLSRSSSLQLEDYFPPIPPKIREQLKRHIHSAWARCGESVESPTAWRGDSESSFVGVAQTWTPEPSSDPAPVEDRIDELLPQIEQFVTEHYTGQRQRFELNVPGYNPLIIWVTLEEGNKIRVELISEEIACGVSKKCHHSSVMVCEADMSLEIDLDEPDQEVVLRFPMATEGRELQNAMDLIRQYLPAHELGRIRLAGRLDLSRIHQGTVEARESMFAGTLESRVGFLRPQEIQVILQDVAETLNILHSFGLVHRDVKPANIMVDHQGRGWLTDISGVVLYQNPAGAGDVATFAFLSRLVGINPANDIFALARMAERLLPGYLPAERTAVMRANEQIQSWFEGEGRAVYETLRDNTRPPAERVAAYQAFTQKFPEFEAFFRAMLRD